MQCKECTNLQIFYIIWREKERERDVMGKSLLDGALLQVGDCSAEQTGERRQAIVSLAGSSDSGSDHIVLTSPEHHCERI